MENEWIYALLTALLPILTATYNFILKFYKMKHDEEMKKLANESNHNRTKSSQNKKVPKKPSQSSPALKV